MPGNTILVNWPRGWVVADDNGCGGKTEINSADPNDHYRPWLEKHAGQQGWDWNWRIGKSVTNNNDSIIEIKFRKGLERAAITAALKWT